MVYTVWIHEKEYPNIDAETRTKAITKAAHLYREETKAQVTIALLQSMARARKHENGRTFYPRPVIEFAVRK